MQKTIQAQLTAFNQGYKEMDIMYHNYAKSVGLSDAAFWILYCISEHNGVFTQRDLCSDWSFTPQTVNSALKLLEKRGVISLEFLPENRKNKRIRLTQEGTALARRVVLPLMQAERDTFAELTEKERKLLLATTQKHISVLQRKLRALTEAAER